MNNGEGRFDSAFDGSESESSPVQKKKNHGVDPLKGWADVVFRLFNEAVAEEDEGTQQKLLTVVFDMIETANERKKLPFRVLNAFVNQFPKRQTKHFGERYKALAKVRKDRQRNHTAESAKDLQRQVLAEQDVEVQRKLLDKLCSLLEEALKGNHLPNYTLNEFFENFPEHQKNAFGGRVKPLKAEHAERLARSQMREAEQLLRSREASKAPPVVYGTPTTKVADEVAIDVATSEVGPGEEGGGNVVSLDQSESPTPAPEHVPATQADLDRLKEGAEAKGWGALFGGRKKA